MRTAPLHLASHRRLITGARVQRATAVRTALPHLALHRRRYGPSRAASVLGGALLYSPENSFIVLSPSSTSVQTDSSHTRNLEAP